VPLLRRSRAGARLTEDGAAFLPHSRALISLADHSVRMLRARRRAMRIDILGRDAAPTDLVRAFYDANDVDIDVIVSSGTISQQTALTDGSVDAAFGRAGPTLPPCIKRIPVCLDPIPILVSRQHRLARRQRVTMAELSGLTAWMPVTPSISIGRVLPLPQRPSSVSRSTPPAQSSAATISWRKSLAHRTSSCSSTRGSSPCIRT